LNLTFGRIHFQIPHGADLWQDPLSNPAWRGSDRADCGSLKFECDSTLRALPRGIGELPWIEALTALQELERNIANYTQGSRAFTALSRSLPCLQHLQILRLQASDVDYDEDAVLVALRAEDVLAIGRALKAWRPPAPAPRCRRR
jgi:hypothetical protein